MSIKLGMISLGCAKNLVDGEHMLAQLADAGVTIVDDVAEADVAVVNTCGFIESAKQERQAHASQRRTVKPSAGEDEQQTPEEAPQRRSAAVSIDADDFGDDDI